MSWKDYFYFDKRDKIAIIILLALIVVAGGLYLFTYRDKTANPPMENTESEKEFRKFLSELKDKENSSPQYKKPAGENRYIHYPHQQKLKAGQSIELNTADTTVLKMIPGIGTSFANRIVKYRNLLGGYHSKNQLHEVYGLDNELFNRISPYITVVPKTRKLNINTIDFKELLRHPYINRGQAKAIDDIRTRKGKIESIKRLEMLDEFTAHDIQRLTHYLAFD